MQSFLKFLVRSIGTAARIAFVVVAFASAAYGKDGHAPNASDHRDDVDSIRVLRDQRYSSGDDRSGLCDVYLPAVTRADGHPVIVVVHGGGWVSGDKWTIAGYSREFAKNGFAAVTVNYRLAPRHKFPAQVDDVRQALLWTAENDERFSFDLTRLGLFGYSAGGHLVTLVASLADEPMSTRTNASLWPKSDRRWSRLPSIRAVCAGGPPCDFRSLPPSNTSLAYFLGGSRGEKAKAYIAASPAAHVSSSDPVTQFIHGENDMIVPIDSSRNMYQAQLAAGIESRLTVLPKQGHMVAFLNPKTSETALEFFRDKLSDRSANPPTLP